MNKIFDEKTQQWVSLDSLKAILKDANLKQVSLNAAEVNALFQLIEKAEKEA